VSTDVSEEHNASIFRVEIVKVGGKQLAICFHAGFFLRLFFDPEYGGDIFLRNIG
jgi:hypothetical protein